MVSIGVQLERDNALTDAKSIIDEYGDQVKIYLRGEPDVVRDKYNSLETKKTSVTPFVINSFPIQFSPTDDMVEKAGLRERTDVQIYTANKDWIANGYDIRSLDHTRATIEIRGERYLIKDKSYQSNFADSFLYITIGCNKE